MSDLVGNPEDRFSRVAAQCAVDYKSIRLYQEFTKNRLKPNHNREEFIQFILAE